MYIRHTVSSLGSFCGVSIRKKITDELCCRTDWQLAYSITSWLSVRFRCICTQIISFVVVVVILSHCWSQCNLYSCIYITHINMRMCACVHIAVVTVVLVCLQQQYAFRLNWNEAHCFASDLITWIKRTYIHVYICN